MRKLFPFGSVATSGMAMGEEIQQEFCIALGLDSHS